MRTSELDFDLPEELVARHPADRRDEARMMRVRPGADAGVGENAGADKRIGAGESKSKGTDTSAGTSKGAGTGASTKVFPDHRFSDLPNLLQPGDLLVLNDTRVIPARLLGRRMPDGGKVEALLLRPADPRETAHALCSGPRPEEQTAHPDRQTVHWWALVKPGKKIRTGDRLVFAPGRLEAVVEAYGEQGSGERLLRFTYAGDWWQTLEEVGHTPLPPYILKARQHDRGAGFPACLGARTTQAGKPAPLVSTADELPEDRERYQTVYAGDERASVAAPTAGLHFTTEILESLSQRGIATCRVQLHVGAGTFQPIKTERVEDHPMHEEYIRVPAETAEAIARTRAAGGRIVAVGTTVMRALETAALVAAGDPVAQTVFRPEGDVTQAFQPAQARQAGKPAPLPSPIVALAGWTRLFVLPGFRFRACDALLTNFHLPRSSLLLLVEAFAGTETIRAAYAEAVRRRYRFFSYGDCMLITE